MPATSRLSGALLATLRDQSGVVARSQLVVAGVSDSAIRARLHAGAWQRLFDGVFCTHTGALGLCQQAWAAVLAAGPGAAASHDLAARLWGLPASDLRLHVTVEHSRKVRSEFPLAVHRSRHLAARTHPVLEPPRTRVEDTVLDRCETLDLPARLVIVSEALASRQTTPGRVRDALVARTCAKGRAELLAVLDDIALGASNLLELRYLADVERAHALPPGQRQLRCITDRGVEYRDVAYVEFATRVELDGRVGHAALDEVWRGMHRDNAGVLAGEATLRYGWADVSRRACEAAPQVAQVLSAHGWTGRPRRCGPSCTLPLAGWGHAHALGG